MIRLIAALLTAAALTACGADGEPIQPTANLGVNVSNSGVNLGASIGARKGPVSVNVNVF